MTDHINHLIVKSSATHALFLSTAASLCDTSVLIDPV